MLAVVGDGAATIAVKGDVEGSTYQAFDRCAEGESPAVDGCVAVVLLDADGNPAAPGSEPAFMRFEGVTDHFSTYVVALLTGDDTTPPTVICDPEPVFLLNEPGAEVSATVSDDGSGPEQDSISVPADTSSVGLKTVSLTGRDLAGNETTVQCGYRVEYAFDGFLDPVKNPPTLNTVKAGQAVPLAWRLTDASGAPVADLAAAGLTAVTLACDLGATPDLLLEVVVGGLQNLGDGTYQLNWKTPLSYANSCKTLRLDLNEGIYRTALFRLR